MQHIDGSCWLRRYVMGALLCSMLLTVDLFAQQFVPPDGEYVIKKDITTRPTGFVNRYVTTQKHLYEGFYDEKIKKWFTHKEPIFTAPEGTDIVDAGFKVSYYLLEYLILLNDGTVYLKSFTGTGELRKLGKIDPQDAEAFKKIRGDALYVVTSLRVYVSRDSGATWQIDTTGFGGATPNDIALDSTQNVYAATTKGLFRQGPTSSVWEKVNSFTATNNPQSVFVDRLDRIYVGGFGAVYVSTDAGATWTTNSSGLEPTIISNFGDDIFGNVYTINAFGSQMYRSMGGTQPWSRIDDFFISRSLDYSQVSRIMNDVGGDSVLVAATAFGAFTSTDQGTTWSESNEGIQAGSVYGLLKLPSGRYLATTNLGVFYRNASDTVWTKTFPTDGYLSGKPLFRDDAGALYTLGRKWTAELLFPPVLPTNWRSTDDGLTWSADTSGLAAVGKGQNPIYFVDETGTQHLAAFDSPAKFNVKKPGEGWTSDTSGYGVGANELPRVFGSDKRGTLFVSVTNLQTGLGTLWKRPVTGGMWTPDTTGLYLVPVYKFATGPDGNPVVGTAYGVYRREAGTWSRLPSPPGLESTVADAVSVDGSGAIFAGFYSLQGFTPVWKGVYYTSDYGTTWTYAGLDSIAIRALVSYGDTTYALSYVDGVYILTRGGVTSVEGSGERIPSSYLLFQNYPNPFNPRTKIRFGLPAGQAGVPGSGLVSLKVYNVLGQEVATLVNEEMNPGSYEVTWDARLRPSDSGGQAAALASGVYFYRIQAGNFVETKKLILLR